MLQPSRLVVLAVGCALALAPAASAQGADQGIASLTKDVGGVKLHYLTAGKVPR